MSADFTNMHISVLTVRSAANGIQFALEALLPYSFSQPEVFATVCENKRMELRRA